MSHPTVGIPPVAFGDALRVWLKVAALSFGGPAGQIAVMHRILVEEKRWVSERRFLHALNYCMLLPGPEAQQLATYIGWLLHRTAGGLVAGGLFIAPGFVAILALSVLYAAYHGSVLIAALFFGLKAAVLAVVVEAVMRIGRRALTGPHMVARAAAAFVAIFFFAVPFPLIIVCAALVGLAGQRLRPDLFVAVSAHGGGAVPAQTAALIADDMAVHTAPSLARSLRVVTVCLLLWATPVLALAWWLGESHVLVREASFFSKAAVVTFGGAYSVLAYIAQQAVETYGWLLPGEMLDGLGMAETTPGPLIMVVQFVGFMGAYRNPAPFASLAAGVLGSLVTVWVTFVPCFLWIFLGAPYIERLRESRALGAALSAITAAVVGVILNLAVWFGLHIAFGSVGEFRALGMRLLVPDLATVDLASVAITTAAFVAMFKLRWGMVRTLAVCTAAGAVWFLMRGLL
ncbi:MAG: chromate efflux transporter [Myxococcales bacterium]|nr:MAG: chromate efflux transporter [Myxococcales bacterium]